MSRYDKYPLHSAVTARDVSAVQAALRTGSKVNQANDKGLTPLMCAALVNCRPCVEELLVNGADVRCGHQLRSSETAALRDRVLTAASLACRAQPGRHCACPRCAARAAVTDRGARAQNGLALTACANAG